MSEFHSASLHSEYLLAWTLSSTASESPQAQLDALHALLVRTLSRTKTNTPHHRLLLSLVNTLYHRSLITSTASHHFVQAGQLLASLVSLRQRWLVSSQSASSRGRLAALFSRWTSRGTLLKRFFLAWRAWTRAQVVQKVHAASLAEQRVTSGDLFTARACLHAWHSYVRERRARRYHVERVQRKQARLAHLQHLLAEKREREDDMGEHAGVVRQVLGDLHVFGQLVSVGLSDAFSADLVEQLLASCEQSLLLTRQMQCATLFQLLPAFGAGRERAKSRTVDFLLYKLDRIEHHDPVRLQRMSREVRDTARQAEAQEKAAYEDLLHRAGPGVFLLKWLNAHLAAAGCFEEVRCLDLVGYHMADSRLYTYLLRSVLGDASPIAHRLPPDIKPARFGTGNPYELRAQLLRRASQVIALLAELGCSVGLDAHVFVEPIFSDDVHARVAEHDEADAALRHISVLERLGRELDPQPLPTDSSDLLHLAALGRLFLRYPYLPSDEGSSRGVVPVAPLSASDAVYGHLAAGFDTHLAPQQRVSPREQPVRRRAVRSSLQPHHQFFSSPVEQERKDKHMLDEHSTLRGEFADAATAKARTITSHDTDWLHLLRQQIAELRVQWELVRDQPASDKLTVQRDGIARRLSTLGLYVSVLRDRWNRRYRYLKQLCDMVADFVTAVHAKPATHSHLAAVDVQRAIDRKSNTSKEIELAPLWRRLVRFVVRMDDNQHALHELQSLRRVFVRFDANLSEIFRYYACLSYTSESDTLNLTEFMAFVHDLALVYDSGSSSRRLSRRSRRRSRHRLKQYFDRGTDEALPAVNSLMEPVKRGNVPVVFAQCAGADWLQPLLDLPGHEHDDEDGPPVHDPAAVPHDVVQAVEVAVAGGVSVEQLEREQRAKATGPKSESLTICGFFQALVRLACMLFPWDQPGERLAHATQLLVERVVLVRAKRLHRERFDRVISSSAVGAVLARQTSQVEHIYELCGGRRGRQNVHADQLMRVLRSVGLFEEISEHHVSSAVSKVLGARDAQRGAEVADGVSLTGESIVGAQLAAAAKKPKVRKQSGRELEYAEFQQVLAALAVYAFPNPCESMARRLERFVAELLYPRVQALAKRGRRRGKE